MPPTDSLPVWLSSEKSIEARELELLAVGVGPAAGPPVRTGEREMHDRAVRREFHASLELANGAGQVAGLEQDLAERRAGDELGRRLGRGLLGPGQRLVVLAAADVREGNLQLGVDLLRRDLQLALELFDGELGLLAQQEHAIRVVDVRRVRITRRQLLEGTLGAGHHARGLEVAGPAGHQHQLAPRSREIFRQHRHAQHREAERFDDARRIIPLEAEVVEDEERLIELADPRQQDRAVIPRHVGHALAADDAPGLGLEEVRTARCHSSSA